MFQRGWPQCEGICRPPDAGSAAAPTRLQQHFVRRDTQRQAQGAVAIVRIDPVVAGLEDHTRRHLDRFVPGAGDLKENPVLALQNDFAIVQPPRHLHQTRAVAACQQLGLAVLAAAVNRAHRVEDEPRRQTARAGRDGGAGRTAAARAPNLIELP